MQIAQVRAKIAPLLGMTDGALRIRQQELQRSGSLKRWRGGGENALVATASSGAMLVLIGMVGKTSATKNTIAPVVLHLWEARCMTPGEHPASGCALLGAALTALIAHEKLCERLDRVELNHDIPDVALIWRDGARTSTFAPYSSRDWHRRVLGVTESGRLDRVSRLPAATFAKIAALIADQEAYPGRSSSARRV